MEKNIIFWIVGIVVLVAVLSNLGGFTGNATNNVEQQALLTIKNPNVGTGSTLEVNIRNTRTTQEIKIFKESGVYTGKRFFTRASRCVKQKDEMNECDAQFRIPSSMSAGRYYVQAKNMRTGELMGNKALFTVN